VPAATIITEANLPGRRTWMDLLEYASSTRSHVIVTSDCEDVSLWAKVLNLGGYDVLMKPFDSEEVLRVISLAWRSWKDRCERRLDGKPPANH
jgi:DNA-binding response OmpR family regulator